MTLEGFLYLVPIIVVSLVLHELAHALVATRMGDPTPREQGRLTLNPLVHLDPLGTAMFVFTAFLSSFIFGWAKPVQVNARAFRRPQQQMALVAVAGPVTNFVLALACAAALVHLDLGDQAREVLGRAYLVNVILGVFNLLPIPPLDGSRIVGAAMNEATYARWSALDQFGMIGLFLVIFIFRDEFFTLLAGAIDGTTSVVRVLVGG